MPRSAPEDDEVSCYKKYIRNYHAMYAFKYVIGDCSVEYKSI